MSSTLDSSIRTSVRTKVLALAGLPARQIWENVEPDPPLSNTDEVLQEARMSSLPRSLADFGNTVNHLQVTHLYEFLVLVPRDLGPEKLDQYSGVLMSGLRPGTVLMAEGLPVRVTDVSKSSIMYPDEIPAHAVVAVTFTMTTFAPNT